MRRVYATMAERSVIRNRFFGLDIMEHTVYSAKYIHGRRATLVYRISRMSGLFSHTVFYGRKGHAEKD